MMELGGWVLLIPFMVLGAFLSVRWLLAITGAVLLIDGLMLMSEIYQPSGPGTYAGWAVLALIFMSVTALVIMWASAGIAGIIRRFRTKNVYIGFD